MGNRQFEYRQELDTLRYTDEQKALLAQLAAHRAERQEKAPVRRRHPVRRVAVLAACAAVLLTVGAGASGGLKTAAEALSALFGGTPAQTEVVDRIGRPLGASDSADGITISADAIIGDKYNICIIYSIRRDDGEPFVYDGLNENGSGSLNLHFDQWRVDTGRRGGTSGSSRFFDAVPGDDAVQYVETFSSADATFEGDLTVRSTFGGLNVRTPDGQYVPIAEGKWDMSFQANLEDCALTFGSGETFEQEGLAFTINEVSLSPIGVMVQYSVDSVVQWSDASGRTNDQDRREVERYMENVEILITRTDGSTLDFSYAGGGMKRTEDETLCSKGGLFVEGDDPEWSIVPLEEIASVTVGGVVYEVN